MVALSVVVPAPVLVSPPAPEITPLSVPLPLALMVSRPPLVLIAPLPLTPPPAAFRTVVNVPEAHRFELLLDGQRIGELAYRQRKGRIAFTHTNVNPAYEGRGFGGRLAEAALADARRQGLTVVPLCPFIAWYIEQHPEHGNLVAADYAGRRDES